MVIKWACDEAVDVAALREHLVAEIDDHQTRIPIDLRTVEGAPGELVDLLRECQIYARSQGKVLSISNALLPMQHALSGRRRRNRKTEGKDADAGGSARSILDEHLAKENPAQYDISNAERIERPRKRRSKRHSSKQRPSARRYAILGGFILVSIAVIGVVIWHLSDTTETTILVPKKGFEAEP